MAKITRESTPSVFERLRLQLGFWSGIFAGLAYIGWLSWSGSWFESCALLAISALAATLSNVALGRPSSTKCGACVNTQLQDAPPVLVEKGVDTNARKQADL